MKSEGRQLFVAIVSADLLILLVIVGIRLINTRGTTSKIAENTSVAETSPGMVVSGSVRDKNGMAVDNVAIYAKVANDAGKLIGTTDAAGKYQSGFYAIPGEETITVWAEESGLQFIPETCYWQHYSGYEMKACDFLALPLGKIFVPIVSKPN
jgi:hypothetical protein